jgi:hypothetical protein
MGAFNSNTPAKCEKIKPGMSIKVAMEMLGDNVRPNLVVGTSLTQGWLFDLPDAQVSITTDSENRVTGCECRHRTWQWFSSSLRTIIWR